MMYIYCNVLTTFFSNPAEDYIACTIMPKIHKYLLILLHYLIFFPQLTPVRKTYGHLVGGNLIALVSSLFLTPSSKTQGNLVKQYSLL
jgi:hypothetical protein